MGTIPHGMQYTHRCFHREIVTCQFLRESTRKLSSQPIKRWSSRLLTRPIKQLAGQAIPARKKHNVPGKRYTAGETEDEDIKCLSERGKHATIARARSTCSVRPGATSVENSCDLKSLNEKGIDGMASNRRRQRLKRHNKDAAWQGLHGGAFGGVQQRRQDKSMKRAAPPTGHLVLGLTSKGYLRGRPRWISD